jgi:hypothetical protein
VQDWVGLIVGVIGIVICDGCKQDLGSDLLIPMCGLLVCIDCLEPYEGLASECDCLRDMDMLERLVRADILRVNRKVR